MADGERDRDNKIHLGDRGNEVIRFGKPKGVCDTFSGVGDGGEDVV